MATNLYGASDDCVCIEGDVDGEVDVTGSGKAAITFSDGTKAKIEYTDEGIWRIDVPVIGTKISSTLVLCEEIRECEDKPEAYSDRLMFADGIRWAKYRGKKVR